jgi:hypothetical protein
VFLLEGGLLGIRELKNVELIFVLVVFVLVEFLEVSKLPGGVLKFVDIFDGGGGGGGHLIGDCGIAGRVKGICIKFLSCSCLFCLCEIKVLFIPIIILLFKS